MSYVSVLGLDHMLHRGPGHYRSLEASQPAILDQKLLPENQLRGKLDSNGKAGSVSPYGRCQSFERI